MVVLWYDVSSPRHTWYTQDCIESSSSVSVGDDSDVSSVIIKRAFDGSQDQSLGEEMRGLQLRKKSFSLPTVHLPVELQAALDNVVSSKCLFPLTITVL